MSAEAAVNSSPRETPVGEETSRENTKGSNDNTPPTTEDSGERDSLTEDLGLSPKQKSKKKKNKRKKANKENEPIDNSNENVEDPSKLDPKDGKTKLNMERQKKMSRNNTEKEEEGQTEESEKKEEAAQNIEEEDDSSDLGIPDELDGEARNKVYQRGLEYINKGKKSSAQKCFMACLTGLADKEGFSFFPQCLKHMADIYYSQEEYEKAIQFIQAEKMYYETALINTTGLQKKLEENLKEKKKGDTTEESASGEPEDPASNRAEEYEKLARLCLKKKQPELALEYMGKATKLRQQLYGPEHPLTKKSLDFFTVVYAEVGKQQYTESLQKFSEKPPEVVADAPSEGGEPGQQLRRRNSGILRTPSEESRNKDKHVRFEEPERDRDEIRQQEEWASHSVIWVLFAVCIVVLACLLLYLYCRLDPGSSTCATWRGTSNYYYMRLKYLYYTWTATPGANFG